MIGVAFDPRQLEKVILTEKRKNNPPLKILISMSNII